MLPGELLDVAVVIFLPVVISSSAFIVMVIIALELYAAFQRVLTSIAK